MRFQNKPDKITNLHFQLLRQLTCVICFTSTIPHNIHMRVQIQDQQEKLFYLGMKFYFQ